MLLLRQSLRNADFFLLSFSNGKNYILRQTWKWHSRAVIGLGFYKCVTLLIRPKCNIFTRLARWMLFSLVEEEIRQFISKYINTSVWKNISTDSSIKLHAYLSPFNCYFLHFSAETCNTYDRNTLIDTWKRSLGFGWKSSQPSDESFEYTTQQNTTGLMF